MKNFTYLVILYLFVVTLFSGCSGFKTIQYDRSYENGKLVREIYTKNAASTFVESKSELAKFRSTQTDKTQSTSVGALSQSSNDTNTVDAAAQFLGTLIKSAK